MTLDERKEGTLPGKPVTVAVVGFGQWGVNHVRTFASLPDVTVACVVDRKADRLAKAAEMFPGIPREEDLDAVLRSPEVDAIVVATEATSHYPLVKAALEAGKHVLCEKPLCESATEADQLARLAERRGLILMVGHVFLFNSGIVKLKELIDAGELGSIDYLSAVRTNLGPIRTDVNASYDLAAHDISIFNWLLGEEPQTVSASGSSVLQPGVEDVVFAAFRYPSGVLAHVHASWLSPKKVRQITVVGRKAMATWDDMDPQAPIAIYDKGAQAEPAYSDYGQFLRLSQWDGDVRLPKLNAEEPLKAQDRAFVECVRSGKPGRADGAFGAAVVRVLEAVDASLAKGSWPIELGA